MEKTKIEETKTEETKTEEIKNQKNKKIIIVLIICLTLIVGFFSAYIIIDKTIDNKIEEKEREKEREQTKENSIFGDWYAYIDDTLYYFEFKKNGECQLGYNDEREDCTYTYDDEVISIANDSNDEGGEFEYYLKSSYIVIEGVKFYSSESKAKKNPYEEESDTNSSEKSESDDNDSFGNILSKYTKEEFIKLCEDIEYDTLARTPDNYKGEYIHFKGEVVQVQENSTEKLAVLRVNTKLSDYDYIENYYEDDTVYVIVYNYDMNNRILEDDIIDMYGVFYGIETYETVLESTLSIPAMITLYYSID